MSSFDFSLDKALLETPVKRAAYSDRTAWLMAVMSMLAYIPFELKSLLNDQDIDQAAKQISGMEDLSSVRLALKDLLNSYDKRNGEALLKTQLGKLHFQIVETFSVSNGNFYDTQAFIARVKSLEETKEDFLVLAFRGTEVKKLADIKTDLNARMVETSRDDNDGVAKVHEGFLSSFNSIKDEINTVLQDQENKGLPVYVTGHSLGGALALIATRYIANNSLGACYTFGSPKVSNEVFIQQIYTPVYRIVNSHDVVPFLPPGNLFIRAFSSLLSVIAFLGRFMWLQRLVRSLKPYSEYRHYGDQRHLSSAAPKSENDLGYLTFPKLRVRSHPNIIERTGGLSGLKGHFWLGLVGDHSIINYVDKLGYYARQRLDRRKKLNKEFYP